MAGGFRGLEALVGEGRTEAFLATALGRDAWRARPGPEAARALFGWDRLNAALAEHRLAAPRLRLERAGADDTKGLYRERRSRRGQPLSVVDPATLNARLREGATLIADAVNELSPPLQALCADLAAGFTCACQANLYASWGTTQGFDVHWDDHDVFVLQVEGRKLWALYGSTRAAPTRRDHHEHHVRPETPIEEIVLEPGDLLYLPRGYWHAAVGMGEPTLHLTIGLTRKTGGDFLHWLADHALAEAHVRADLPLEADDARLGQHLAQVLRRLAAEEPAELARLFRRHAEAGQATRPQLSFPFIGGAETTLSPQSPIALAEGVARLTGGERAGEIDLTLRGVVYTIDAALAGPLEALAAGRTVTYASLLAAAPERIRAQVAPFVADMVGRGVFVVRPGPGA